MLRKKICQELNYLQVRGIEFVTDKNLPSWTDEETKSAKHVLKLWMDGWSLALFELLMYVMLVMVCSLTIF